MSFKAVSREVSGGCLWVVLGWPWGGLGVGLGCLGVVLVWYCGGLEVVPGCSLAVVMGWSGGGLGVVWGWSWEGLGVVLRWSGVVLLWLGVAPVWSRGGLGGGLGRWSLGGRGWRPQRRPQGWSRWGWSGGGLGLVSEGGLGVVYQVRILETNLGNYKLYLIC